MYTIDLGLLCHLCGIAPIGYPEIRVRQPFLEARVVAELFEQFSVVGDELYRREHAACQGQAGRPRRLPCLKKQNNPTVEVRNVATYSPLLRRQDWQTYRVKESTRGPVVWKVKRLRVWLKDENGLPGAPHHLLVAVNVLNPEEVKYFLSNAPEETPVETLLLVAFSRWKIERMFEDGKGELGLDHFEVRKYQSIQRHLILSGVSYLFLAEFQATHGEKNPDLTLCQIHRVMAQLAPVWRQGGRCSRALAESIQRQLLVTQQRAAKARASHHKRTLRRLREIGVFLKDLRNCKWPHS
ncbi:MAG TPA: transposase [Phycisphaerae bacterium]|nr:transposase [Phycisphaerae bacterium]